MSKRIFSITKFFVKKNWKHLVALASILTMFWAGFYCAWQIQENKAQVKEDYYTRVLRKVSISLDYWEEEVRKLQRESGKYDREAKKRRDWNRDFRD